MNSVFNYFKKIINNLYNAFLNIRENISTTLENKFVGDSSSLFKYLFGGLAIIAIIVVTVIFTSVFSTKSISFDEIEIQIENKAVNYIKNNNININDGESKFLSFNDLKYTFNKNTQCENTGGILVKKNKNNYEYEFYYNCKNHNSDTVKQVIKDNDKINNYISIKGNNNIYIPANELYNDPGYDLIDKNATVTVNSNVIQEKGVYYVEYNVKVNDTQYTAKRIVVVTDEVNEDIYYTNKNKPTIKLNDGTVRNILRGTAYEELGYIAKDSNGNNLTDSVTVSSNVDTNTVGSYEIKYTVIDSDYQSTTIIRNINVIDIIITTSDDQYTNKDITVNVSVIDNDYYYTALPNYSNNFTKDFTYKVHNKGTYIFTVHSKTGNSVSKKITISNFDNDAPIGTCFMDSYGLITTKVNDSISGISGYSYLISGTYTNYLVSSSYKTNYTSNPVVVRVKDSAGNISYINCGVAASAAPLDPIIPKKFKYSAISDTLKVWVVDEGDHYMTRIWAKEPYKQVHLYTASDYGKHDDSFGDIMNKAVKNAIDKNKIAVAWNDCVGTWYGGKSSDAWGKYKNDGLIIQDGKILRNDTTSKKERGNLYAIDNKNVLNYYPDSPSQSVEKRTRIYNSVINGGVLNTLSAARRAVKNGVNVARNNRSDGSSYYSAEGQGMCQINANNYVYITLTKSYMPKKVGEILEKLGCIEGYIIDGGGSTTFYLKNKPSNDWTHKIKGGGRSGAWSILYWTEL